MEIFLTTILSLILILKSSLSCNISVETNLGIYLGCSQKSWNGENFFSFRGIRFAKPPIGDLRFKDPQPWNETFNSIYDATSNGFDCPSIIAGNASEDCLFLNIHTKRLPDTDSPLLPVIVFVHPGGFYLGSSPNNPFGPEYLMQYDLLLVSFNYRLGPLGFLNLNSAEYPGNAGLKDQVMALRWIKAHINKFGGDASKITLMGYSAGAVSVSLHLTSPMSQDLFHRAIIMSGTIPPQLNLPQEQIYLAFRQCQVLNCDCKDISEVLRCLDSHPGSQIAATLRKMFYFGKDNPIYLWLPVLEQQFGQERFLTENPFQSLEAGQFARVPILIGFTKDEFCSSSADIIQNQDVLHDFNENFKTLAPTCFLYNETRESATNDIKEFYFNNSRIASDHFHELCSLFSDSIVKFGSHRFAEFASKFTDVYTYRFSYKGEYSNLYYPRPNEVNGVEHMDDLMYIFKGGPVIFKPSDSAAKIVSLLTGMIFNFATKGTPLETIGPTGPDEHLEITDHIELVQTSNFENFEFWKNLF